MSRTRLKALLQAAFSFSLRERKRVLLLLPLLVALCLLFVWQGKPRFEKSFTRYSDRVLDSVRDNRAYSRNDRNRTQGPTSENRERSGNTGSSYNDNDYNYNDENSSPDRAIGSLSSDAASHTRSGARNPRQDSLFVFDPNTVTQSELVALGFSPKQAQVILRYRGAGARFRKPKDFARCYTVSGEKFEQLAPYIRIAAEFSETSRRDNPATTGTERKSTAAPNRSNEPIYNNRPDATPATPTNAAPSARKYIDNETYTPARRNRPIELNSADSATLVSVHGIGALTASRILRYREALGGFVRVTQLQEIAGMTDANYQLIIQQICVDSSKIQKIDINFASPKRMQEHPYLPPKVLNRVLKYRQLKGGWSSTGDLIEQHILSAEQAERLMPYLYFGAL